MKRVGPFDGDLSFFRFLAVYSPGMGMLTYLSPLRSVAHKAHKASQGM